MFIGLDAAQRKGCWATPLARSSDSHPYLMCTVLVRYMLWAMLCPTSRLPHCFCNAHHRTRPMTTATGYRALRVWNLLRVRVRDDYRIYFTLTQKFSRWRRHFNWHYRLGVAWVVPRAPGEGTMIYAERLWMAFCVRRIRLAAWLRSVWWYGELGPSCIQYGIIEKLSRSLHSVYLCRCVQIHCPGPGINP